MVSTFSGQIGHSAVKMVHSSNVKMGVVMI